MTDVISDADAPTAAEPSQDLIGGWTVWRSPGSGQWHARKNEAPMRGLQLHDNSLKELRERTGTVR